jgi:serine/threonine-protein kinase
VSLGYWLVEEGQYEEAAALLDESVAIRRKALGEDHPQVAGVITVQAHLMLATQRYEDARRLAAEARRMLEATMPSDSWQVAAAMNTEGAALVRLGSYAQAEPLLLASRAGLEQAPVPGLAERGRVRLVELYTAWGRPEEAAKYRSRS